MVLAAGKHRLTDAVESAEVARFSNSTVVCNAGGSGLMQHLQDLSANVSDLDAKHSAQIANLEAQVSLPCFRSKTIFLMSAREHFLHIYATIGENTEPLVRNIAPRQTQQPQKFIRESPCLTNTILHGGNAEFDALMFHERHPVQEIAPFQCLYGLGPDLIKEFASKGHRSIINLLDTAGAVHYESHHTTIAQQEVFDKVIELVHNRNFEDAEEASTKFLSAVDFVELAGVTPINEQED